MLKVEHASPRRIRLVHMQPARPQLVGLRARAGYGQASRRGARTRRAVARASTALRPYPSKAARVGFHAATTGHHGASRKPALAKYFEPQGCAGTADPNRPGDRHGFAACRKAHTGAALGKLGHAAAPWHRADLGKRTHTIGDVGTGTLMDQTDVRALRHGHGRKPSAGTADVHAARDGVIGVAAGER